jgi:predicted transcriptional regulator
MHQVDIVDETDWSKSKVSMLLWDMEDEGTISKLRVGRENIVSLAGHEPDAAGSPFEDHGDDGTADSVRGGNDERP